VPIVSLMDLWLPIVLSAVAVFVVSSLMHMVLPHHHGDYAKLPEEEQALESLRRLNLSPGDYSFPRPSSMKELGSAEMAAKFERGPVGMLTVLPSGRPAMGKSLGLWFVYCLVVGVVVAYLTGRTTAAGAGFLGVFRVASTAAFLAYSAALPIDSIWMGRSWSTTLKHVFDGLVYALVTGALFGWLWPA
jgi:hypothetical protein